MAGRYELVVFDFDGTLADSAEWFLELLNDMAERHGFRAVDDAQVEILRRKSTREIIKALNVKPWRLPFIARDMRRASAQAADEISLFPGIAALLETIASDGTGIAIVTSNSEVTVRRVLGESARHVTGFSCGSSLFGKARKLRRLARDLKLAPQKVLCVGDESRDVEAARAAGMASAAVTWGYAAREALAAARPDFTVETVDELGRLIRG